MDTNRKSFTVVHRFLVMSLLIGLPAGGALAAEPAESVRKQSDIERPFVGPHQGEPPVGADEAKALSARYREQAAYYRSLGGVGYKTGLVQRAEADAARYAAMADALRAPSVNPPPRSPRAEYYGRLAEQYRKMGGVGYKTGAVQWAEAQERKYDPRPSITAPRPVAGRWDWRWGKPVERSLAQ